MNLLERQLLEIDEELDAFFERHEQDNLGVEAKKVQHNLQQSLIYRQYDINEVDYFNCKMYGLWGRE